MEDERPNLWFLMGFQRLQQPGKHFLVQAAMVSRVPEGCLSELMSDPRLAQTYPDLWHSLATDMAWLIMVQDSVWEALGTVAGIAPAALKDKCIKAGHTAFHFCWRRFLEPASDLPWKLCRGDLASNIDDLAAGEEPEEPVAHQLWQMAQSP
eukprot:1744844-Lingulodinium_polyedra.AAC.1